MSKRMLITAGPTHEPIDAVRYIANRSSGKMGLAIARAARDAGWSVTLLLGPTLLDPPEQVDTHRFETCSQLQSLLDQHFSNCDVLVMAAAVADYQSGAAAHAKIPRSKSGLTIELIATPDLVAGCSARKRDDQFIVGFALERPESLVARSHEKLVQKKLNAMVANPFDTMGSDQINPTVLTPGGEVPMPSGSKALDKSAFAVWLVEWIGKIVSEGR